MPAEAKVVEKSASSSMGKSKDKAGKKKPRETQPSEKWKCYETTEGKLKRKNHVCPKCGPGVFMGNHKTRWACGKCGYTEYVREAKK